MADSNNSSQRRTYDPQARASGADGTEGRSDPLAELARLIGQSDPFSDFERARSGGQAVRSATGVSVQPSQDWPEEPAPPHADASYPGYRAAPDPYVHDAHAAAAPQDTGAPPNSEPYPQGAYHPDPEQAQEYATDAYQQDYDPYDDTEGQGLDETDYLAQQQQRRRRRRLATVTAILVFAVVGGAGAYGYRMFFGAVTRNSPPPVIKADTTPNKVIPSAHAGDSRSAKLIYDRVGDGQQAERVVPREEKPVEIKTATIAPGQQAAPPPPDASAAAPQPTIPVTARSPAGQVLPPTASEPTMATHANGAILPYAKKVRTVVIRPDMTMVPNPAPASDPEPPQVASPQVQQAEAEPETLTRSVSPMPAASTPSPAPSRPAPPAPRQATSGPLSLSPGDVSSAAPEQTQRTASRAALKPAIAGGTYVVQVSSQRSEADANASYRTLQGRYPGVLAGRSAFVRRADLGGRGVYYRSMVGPFATADEAVKFCGSLKAAGGQCIIHRN